MKTKIIILLVGCTAVAAVAGLYQVASLGLSRPLAEVVPEGAMLYIEAKDFGSLIHDWNGSPEKAQWIKSDNYRAFSRSKLFLRLQRAQQEFAAAAGFKPDMNLVEQMSGRESAMAVYDIGQLEFLFISHMHSAQAMDSDLWKKRGSYEIRDVNGTKYYVHTDPDSKRTIAFAVMDDYVVLATREDLVSAAIALLQNKGGRALKSEDWYGKAVAAAKEPGDLRMVLDLGTIAGTHQFNSYWIQQNVDEIKQYSVGVSDLFRSNDEYREERVLLPADEAKQAASKAPRKAAPSDVAATAVGQLAASVPGDAGFYQVWATDDPTLVSGMVRQKLLAPHFGQRPASKVAPGAPAGAANVGSEGDLEVRFDVPPQKVEQKQSDPLLEMLQQAKPVAVMKVERTGPTADSVFVAHKSAIVVAAAADWNGEAARSALQQAIEGMSTSRLGLAWTAKTQGGSYYQLDGVEPLCIATVKNLLVISNEPELLAGIIAKLGSANGESASYAAGFRHDRERGNYYKMMRSIEDPEVAAAGIPAAGNTEREPKFMSDNVVSLSKTWQRVRSETMVVRNLEDRELQTVHYRWSQ